MASTSQSSASSGAARPVKTVGQEFWEHSGLTRGQVSRGPLPRPLNLAEYKKNNPMRQTDYCTFVAVQQYNSQGNGTPKIRNAVGVHSNMFILSHHDPNNYFHLYFEERRGGKTVRSYFAELKGTGGPETLVTCRIVNKTTATVLNCRHCFGGILHPMDGGFHWSHTGCIDVPRLIVAAGVKIATGRHSSLCFLFEDNSFDRYLC